MVLSNPIPMKDPADYIDYEQAEALISAAQSERDKLILGLLWRCGLRAFEIGKLKVKDLQINEPVINVEGKGGKYLRTPVEPELYEWLLDACNNRDPESYIISGYGGKGINRLSVWRTVRRVSKRSGILLTKANKPIHPHCLRHSLAIWMVKSGVPIEKIRQILRHSSLVPTTYYLQFSMKDLAEDYFVAWQKAKQR